MRFSKQHARVLATAVAVCAMPAAQAQGAAVGAPTAQVKHFDPKGNQPSTFTIELRKGITATLPFDDKRDFDEAKKGFIAEPPYQQIMADAGNVAWDMASYQWLLQGKDFQSIHPSLQRQAVLNMAYGEHTMAVDTHVFRVGNRTGLAPGNTPLEVELGLEKVIPSEFMLHAHHWLILHGRYTCLARKPRCEVCVINDLCRWPEKTV